MAKSAGKIEQEVHDERRAYLDWFGRLQTDFQILERQILDKNEMEGRSYKEKIRWQGVIPLMAMGDMWARINGKSMEEKDFEKAMNRLWLKFQFPKGWISLPPEKGGDLPFGEMMAAEHFRATWANPPQRSLANAPSIP